MAGSIDSLQPGLVVNGGRRQRKEISREDNDERRICVGCEAYDLVTGETGRQSGCETERLDEELGHGVDVNSSSLCVIQQGRTRRSGIGRMVENEQ